MQTANNTELSNLQVSIRSLAELSGQHRDAVRSAISRARLEPSGTRGGYPSYSLKAALRALTARQGDANPETLTPTDRKALADAKLREHTLLVKEGEYLPREAYRNATAQSYARCASSIRSIPDGLERKLGLNPQQVEFAEEVITRILGTLHDDMRRAHEESAEATPA